MYAAKNIKVETARGPLFFSDEIEAFRVKGIIEYLNKNTQKNDTLVVFPEAIGLNYFSQRENPLILSFYNPPAIRLAGEETIISWLVRYKVDYIVILQRATGEYGFPYFGIQYGQKISAWIYDQYSIAAQFGPAPFSSDEFGAIIFKKKKLRHDERV